MTMSLMKIHLNLGRTDGFPYGSSQHGYEFVAPLTKDNRIDLNAWRQLKARCRVVRFWGGEPEEQGTLRHVGRGWRFDYDSKKSEDDEPFFKLDKHPLLPGAYVSITEHDGVQRPFRVVAVTPAV
jgi:hypothetical protein